MLLVSEAASCRPAACIIGFLGGTEGMTQSRGTYRMFFRHTVTRCHPYCLALREAPANVRMSQAHQFIRAIRNHPSISSSHGFQLTLRYHLSFSIPSVRIINCTTTTFTLARCKCTNTQSSAISDRAIFGITSAFNLRPPRHIRIPLHWYIWFIKELDNRSSA